MTIILICIINQNYYSVLWYIFRFYDNHRFPGVIGCIDCTHIAIFPPQVHDAVNPEHLYVNRKGYHSINVQLVSV